MAMALIDLKKGDRFDGILLVKQCEVRVAQNGSRFLDATLCDRTAEINAKAWEWGETPAPEKLSVVQVRAMTNEYMGKLQLKLESLRPADVSKANLSLLIPCAPGTPDAMLGEIYETIDAMEDDDIKLLCAAIIDENKEQLRYWPAAVSFHHSERSGLLHHTTSMLRCAKALLPNYPFLDADLLLGGVILHDICKIRELSSSELGLAGEYTKSGLLLGHITMGTGYVMEMAKKLELESEMPLLLSHMVVSHHSEPDFGSPRRPMFAEAEMLHHLDTLDARMYDMHHNISTLKEGEFTGYIRSLENRKLYRHSKFKD